MGDNIDDDKDDIEQNARWFHSIADLEANLESPVDLNITRMKAIEMPPIIWHNHDLPPKKMKLTNTGYTMILSGKWHQERPYISKGPLLGNYVFSQLHFHWGKNDAEGSEHSVDGVHFPIEMHVVTFKANYLTQEAALKEKDGIAVLAYLFKLQGGKNPAFQLLIENIMAIQRPHSSFKLDPIPLSFLVKKFERDYFLYWGSVTTTVCIHYILWMISREPIGVSTEQVDELRILLDANEEPLERNFRDIQPLGDRQIFHVCPSSSRYSTMLPLP